MQAEEAVDGLQGSGAVSSTSTAARRMSRTKPASVSAPVQVTGKVRLGGNAADRPHEDFSTLTSPLPSPGPTTMPDEAFTVPPLHAMLAAPATRHLLLAFARQVFQEESLLFWVACYELSLLSESAERIRRAQKIWADFLEPGAPFEVCVDFARRVSGSAARV